MTSIQYQNQSVFERSLQNSEMGEGELEHLVQLGGLSNAFTFLLFLDRKKKMPLSGLYATMAFFVREQRLGLASEDCSTVSEQKRCFSL